ncbi:MAG: PLP-dependent aminotransferase family protein [Piscinibacter sp.]|uniref:MocR-like pyridoxine biosynthesis transcription factor PdxR n=1 Tax=Piscinibacter sp. TaxID=1903157 RepID=UPI0011D74B6A|nr:PLP-dependent aminotransferase family protein [Piscinibacter sp.]MBP5991119.1 PLP-dependent aminotransferase family protein [Piscinibacter sp.]MBP6028331.1 PLP-dependent aminotransferase family protein [Piscinibacter sp.]TXH61654.1 MAG: PLP-dependent aminotransferase family protein [Burkholderiaceae bacterium]
MRRAADIEFALGPRPAGVPRHGWLYAEIRAAVHAGRLAAGARLPPSRDFARQLGVSRGTVLAALAQLAAEGYLAGAVGRGTFVCAQLPVPRERAAGAARAATVAGRLSQRGALLAASPFPLSGQAQPARPFRPNQPDLDAFPFALWNRIAARRSRLSQRAMLADGEARGYRPLRQAIAEHLRYTMRIDCSDDQVIIVGGVQQVLDLCARLLLDPGDDVWMEDPGYPGALRVLRAAGARVVGVPVDRKGVDVEAGIRLAPSARLAYVTPGRQSPLGVPLALGRRMALLHWARRAHACVIEDDYDSEYRYTGVPLAALKSLDTQDCVIYAGSFSKLLFPSLRLAYAVVPRWLADPFAAALSLTARHVSLLPQAVLHEFIVEGHYGRHIRRMRLAYGERAAALEDAVTRRLGGLLAVLPITTGLDTAAFLPEACDDVWIARQAVAAGVETRPLSAHRIAAPAPSGLVLGFAAFDRAQIEAGMGTLAQVLEAALSDKRTRGRTLEAHRL